MNDLIEARFAAIAARVKELEKTLRSFNVGPTAIHDAVSLKKSDHQKSNDDTSGPNNAKRPPAPLRTNGCDLLPPIPEKPDPKKQTNESRKKIKFGLDIATFVIIFAYTTVAALQWFAILDSNKIARQSNRPYIGVNEVALSYVGPNATPDNKGSPVATAETNRMAIRVEIKNFGTTAATNVRNSWRWFFDDVEYGVGRGAAITPVTGFPGQALFLTGLIGTEKYEGVVAKGTTRFSIEVIMDYEWPGSYKHECQRMQYDRVFNQFTEIRSCTGK